MIPKEIAGFFDENGRLTAFPAKMKKKLMVLCVLADQIPADTEYTEREFSDFLRTLHTFGDPATLRREMYDYRLVNRDANGTHYRLNPERPSAEELIEQCK